MARGTTQEAGTINSAAGTSFNNAQNAYNTASTGYQSILNNPGYTPGTINAQTVSAQTPYSVQSAQVQGELARRAATSGNTAGMAAGEDAAARQSASGQSQAALEVQNNAANDAQKEQLAALQGMGGLYGQSLSGAGSLYGTASRLYSQRSPSPFGSILSGAASGFLGPIVQGAGKAAAGSLGLG